MAFLKGKKDQISLRTEVRVETDLGKTIPVNFVTTWKTLTVTQAKQLRDDSQTEGFEEEAAIRQYLVGWRDLTGNDGQDVPYSDDVLAEMLETREYRQALGRALLEVAYGRKAVEQGN